MKRSLMGVAMLIAASGLALSLSAQAPAPQTQAKSAPSGAGQQPPQQFQMPPASEQTLKHIADLRQQIAGKENLPASQVFKNVQVLKDMPAGRLLAIMRVAYAASLGVECTHCHVAGEWEKDDKEAKATARKMWAFMRETNDRLAAIKQGASINCTTCHRGDVKPALNLPAKSS